MFKLDSPLMNFLNKIADIMILNVLFLIFSIPFFTVGAAFSASYYMCFKMVKNEETYIVRGFWKAFKQNFKQGTAIWLILVVVFGILTVDFRIILYSGIEFAQWIRIAMLAVTFIILLGVMFMFPLQARFVNPVKNTIKNAFLIAISHFPTAVLLIAIYAVPIIILYFIPQSLPILILLAFGAVIYLKSFLLLRVFKRYEDALVDINGKNTEQDNGIFAESDRMEREQQGIVEQNAKPKKEYRNGKFVEMPENNGNLEE